MFKSKEPEVSTEPALPAALIARIAKYSASATAATLIMNRETRAWIQPDLDERAAKQLMDYVLKPTEENVKKAKAMIAANPKIMFIETSGVEWASGIDEDRVVPRRVKSSALKAALGTGDSEIYHFMAQYFDKVVYRDENGETIETGIQRAQRQMQEQFPSGFEYPQVEAEFTALMDKIVNALTNDTTSPETRAVLNEFRHYFVPKEVTEGHHFNLNYLIEAFNRYNQNWAPWNGNQLSLFWRKVIGYLERLVPAIDAQAFCQGLYYRVEQNQPPARSLTLHNYQSSSDISYFPPISSPPTRGLGFDFAIYACLAAPAGGHATWPHRRGGVLEKLCRAKTSALNNFKQNLEQRAHPTAGEQGNPVRNSLK